MQEHFLKIWLKVQLKCPSKLGIWDFMVCSAFGSLIFPGFSQKNNKKPRIPIGKVRGRGAALNSDSNMAA